MSAVIIPFPCGRRDRAKPATERRDHSADLYDDTSRETVFGRVRAIGHRFRLNSFDRAALVNLARLWLDTGVPVKPTLFEYGIYARAEAAAQRMAARHQPPPGGSAA